MATKKKNKNETLKRPFHRRFGRIHENERSSTNPTTDNHPAYPLLIYRRPTSNLRRKYSIDAQSKIDFSLTGSNKCFHVYIGHERLQRWLACHER